MKRPLFLLAAPILVCAAAAAVFPQAERKAPPDVSEDATWSGGVVIDAAVRVTKGTLTIAPGTKVTFTAGGSLGFASGASLAAAGTKENPIEFTGDKCGQITGAPAKLLFERCRITGLGGRYGLQATAGPGGIALRDCELSDSAGVSVSLAGPFEVTRCRVANCRDGITCYGRGKVSYVENTLVGCGLGVGAGADGTVTGNVVLGGTISGWNTEKLLVENNYVHQSEAGGTYGLLRTVGVVRNNVIRGASWVSAGLGGEITRNVFISLPAEGAKEKEGGFDKNCTHEHICGLAPKALVARNIFVGQSYGAVMGIGDGTGSDSVIRNNTFDMRSGGHAVYLNHLPKSDPKSIVVRGNLFIRSGSVCDEKGVPDSLSAVDYNLWSMSGKGKDGRFSKVAITGAKEGEGSFGGHDVPPWADRAKDIAPADVVTNPDVTFPFTDDDLLARKHTVAELLDFYRRAYAPKAGSPAIDAGDPVDKSDPDVKDGKPDIGAIEHTPE